MTTSRFPRVALVLGLALVVVAAVPLAAAVPQHDEGRRASDLIVAAVRARLGGVAEVTVRLDGLEQDAAIFRDAVIDPSGRLGRDMRVTLVAMDGARLPVSARIDVVAAHAVTRRAVPRGAGLTAEDLEAVVGALVDVPLRPLPGAAELVGAQALRPLPAGAIVQEGNVRRPRAVEPGDDVVVIVRVAEAEVRASFVAADGGRIGDVVRVVNPATKQFIRARVLRAGLVEVIRVR